MKRIRRLSVEIERREVTVSLGGKVTSPAEDTACVQAETPRPTGIPLACPDCGAAWITMAAYAGDVYSTGLACLESALQQSGVHLHVSDAGEVRICSQSFEELKEMQ